MNTRRLREIVFLVVGISTPVGVLAVNASASRMGRREGRAFALVGAAAVIAGILICDDAGTVIAIGGAGLALYGLYIWQR